VALEIDSRWGDAAYQPPRENIVKKVKDKSGNNFEDGDSIIYEKHRRCIRG
jgi:hypothetical protein